MLRAAGQEGAAETMARQERTLGSMADAAAAARLEHARRFNQNHANAASVESMRYYNRVNAACGHCLSKYGTIKVLECPTLHHADCHRRATDPNHRGPCTKPCTRNPSASALGGRPCRFHDGHIRECEPVLDGDTDYTVPEKRPHGKRTRRDGASASTP